MNYFEFHPVGQGLFYTGSILDNSYNFVYDCGSDSKGDYLDKAIDEYVYYMNVTHSKINFINISHLHKDHFNGLMRLCKNIKVDRIYLPYLGKYQNVLNISLAEPIFQLPNDRERDTELFYFAASLYDVNIENELPRYEFLLETEIEYIGIDGETTKESDRLYSRKSFSVCDKKNPYWHFEFFNNRISNDTLSKFEKKIKEKIDKYNKDSNKNFHTVIDFVRAGDIEELHKIYIEVFGKGNAQNLTSTVLVHYPEKILWQLPLYIPYSLYSLSVNKYIYIYESYHINKHFYCYCKPNYNADITILTGDAKLDRYTINAIASILRDESKCILQIPHHGSYPNWHAIDGNIIEKCEKFVIPFGLGRSKHPNLRTIDELHTIPDAVIIEVNQIHSFIYLLG